MAEDTYTVERSETIDAPTQRVYEQIVDFHRWRAWSPPSGEGSQVTWTMTGPKTLMTRVMGIFTSMDKIVGKDFEKGLARLKAVAER